MTETTFYTRWIVANAFGEAIGLGSTFILGMLFAPLLIKEQDVRTIIAGMFIAVISGIILEGVIVGYFQGRVLCQRLEKLLIKEWIIATSLGAGVAWLLGMLPSTIMSLVTMDQTQASGSTVEPSAIIQYSLAVVLGLITGPILGFAQYLILKKHVEQAVKWLWANALAWAVGMLLIFIGMDFVPWERRDLLTAVCLIIVTLLAGAAVGSIHGRILLRLTRTIRVRVNAVNG